MSVLFVKQQSSVFEPPFGGLKGNVCDLSLARWKACGRLTVGYNWTFFVTSTSTFVEGVGQIEDNY